MRELAYIQKIKSLTPISGADKIEKAEVLGWELVVKKSDFQVGDLCVYCEIDSILPELPCFEFLRPRKFRIKTIRLKSQISQGIAFPLSILTDVDPSFNINKIKVGDDVTEVLKIVKHDPEVELDVEPVQKTWFQKKISYWRWKLFNIKPVKSDSFPSFVPKTDEERVQKMSSHLERNADALMYITEKVEGTSGTFIFRRKGNWLAKFLNKDYVFMVCSRNRVIYNSQKDYKTTHHNMQVAIKYNLLDKMKKLNRNLAIQGEVIGPKIQGNLYKLPEFDLMVFLIYDLDKQKYCSFHEMMVLIEELNLTSVPFITAHHSLVNNVKHYVELSKGKSKINSSVLREGIVVRSMKGNFSFKSINPEYLLHNEL